MSTASEPVWLTKTTSIPQLLHTTHHCSHPGGKENSRHGRLSLFHCFIYCCIPHLLSAHTHCFIDSGVCASLALTVSTWMRKHLEKSSFSMTSGCFLHTHTHPGDDSVVCVFRLGRFDVTTERKRRSSLGDHDNANWIREVSCWCHGWSCPGVLPFPPHAPCSMAVKLAMGFLL